MKALCDWRVTSTLSFNEHNFFVRKYRLGQLKSNVLKNIFILKNELIFVSSQGSINLKSEARETFQTLK